MTVASRPRRPSLLAVLCGFAVAAGLTAVAAQPPEVEDPKAKPPAKKVETEDEDPKGGIKKKVVVDDPDTRPKGAAGGTPPTTKLDELARAADDAANPQVKTLYAKYAVPFDRLTQAKGGPVRVKPIPLFRTDPAIPKQFGVTELDANNVPQPVRGLAHAEVRRIEHFEELVLAETDSLLKPPTAKDDVPAADRLPAAERLLAAALRFHDYAVDNDARQGRAWAEVRRSLADRLRDAGTKELQAAVAASDWPAARAAGNRLLAALPQDAVMVGEVGKARVAEAEVLLKSKAHAEQVKARELLDEFEGRFPGAGGEPARKLRRELASEAARLLALAQADKAAGNLVRAGDYLRQAEDLDPTNPGLLDLKRNLGTSYPVLTVGVRTLPERMTPDAARTDSERLAVELLFEGLLEEVPDPVNGTRYRPGAAVTLPSVAAGGRTLFVRTASASGSSEFGAHDVVETVKRLRDRPDGWPAAGLAWLEDLPAPVADGSVRLGFRHAHPDPRSLLTFKLVPARQLTEPKAAAAFADRPFGTGPYRIHTMPDRAGRGPREVIFVANPAYGRTKDRPGLPHVREIRFVEVARIEDALDEFRKGRLHILPDLTPNEMERALGQGGKELGGRGQVYTATSHRRVYVLAVNHRRPLLQNRDLRKGLSQAIDRDAILGGVFRTTALQHRHATAAMTGPFPPSSWAAPKGVGPPVPLTNRDEAVGRLRRYLAAPGAVKDVRLTYPDGDPLAAAACDRIKANVAGLFTDPAAPRVNVILDPKPARDVRRFVETEQQYDLAYLPFDYPDDWHPYGLAAFLDPAAAGRDGRNVTGYLTPEARAGAEDRALGGELAALLEHRDVAGDVAPRAARIHALFNDCVPFIPLWQLDRHTLVSNRLKIVVDDSAAEVSPEVLNPAVLFHNVARWRLE